MSFTGIKNTRTGIDFRGGGNGKSWCFNLVPVVFEETEVYSEANRWKAYKDPRRPVVWFL